MLFRSMNICFVMNDEYAELEKPFMEFATSKGMVRSEERRVGKSVDLGGRRIIKKTFFQAEDGIRDIRLSDWSSDVCSSDLQVLIFWQEFCEIFRFAECIQINKYRVSFHMSRIFHAKMIRVCEHGHNLLLNICFFI